MKKFIAILCILASIFGIFGCSDSSYQVTEVANITMSISDVSSVGATVTITDTNNNQEMYGEWYEIEKEINGKWRKIKTKEDAYFNLLGYLPDQNDQIIFHIDWEWLYGKLPAGKYRLLKEIGVMDNKQYIAVEFEIQ